MILARNSITLHHLRDITTVVWYYKLQASTASPPAKPTTETPSGWSTTEPSYTEGSTNSLYVVQKTTFSDGTFEYSDVSLSTSYEAAKAAYNKSVQAKDAADAALQQSVWYATCATAAETTAKEATISPTTTDFALTAGTVVNVKFNYTNSGAVGSLTLNVNATGAKPIKYINNGGAPGNIASAGYLRSNNMYQFLYDGTNWIVQFNYNTNYVDRVQYGISLAASAAISAARIAVLGTDGKLHILNTTAFDITCPPLYVATAYTADNVTAAATRATNYRYWGTAFSFTNTHAIAGAAAGKTVYIVGTLNGTIFTPNSTVLTCTEPTTEDGLYYMRLGRMNTAANGVLEMDHPIYVYYDGAFMTMEEAEAEKAKKVADNYLSSDNTGIMVADMTDGTQYTPSIVPSGTKNTFINEDSFQVRDGTDILASFGTTAIIGKAEDAHFEQSQTRLRIVGTESSDEIVMGPQSSTTITREETYSVPGYSTDESAITPGSVEITLPAELKTPQTISLTAGSTTHNIPTGQTYSYTGTDYTISYNGDILIAVTNSAATSLSVRVTYQITQPSEYGIRVTTPAVTRIKARTVVDGNTMAEGGLYANQAGKFGLYDTKHTSWLIYSDTDGHTRIPSLAPTVIYAEKVGAPSAQSSWKYADISLSPWSVIAVRANVRKVRQYLIFFSVATGVAQYLTDHPSEYVRAGFLAKWDTNRVYVRWVEGNATSYQYIYFDQVLGLVRK